MISYINLFSRLFLSFFSIFKSYQPVIHDPLFFKYQAIQQHLGHLGGFGGLAGHALGGFGIG